MKMNKFYVFFTTKHSQTCLKYSRFGATSVNSLADVKKGDTAFIFDGTKRKLYGPLDIISDSQFYEDTDIYGRNKGGAIKYPNRIAFTKNSLKEISYSKVYAQEASIENDNYILNKTVLSILIANKQVSSMPLTNKEGKYLEKCIIKGGNDLKIIDCIQNDTIPILNVIDHVIGNRKRKSESIFEMLLMEGRIKNPLPHLNKDNAMVYNQFIIGFQRQVDILSIQDGVISIIEIKTRINNDDPYDQLSEYYDLAIADFRLSEFKSNNSKIKLIALLEHGNSYLSKEFIYNNEELYKKYKDNDLEIYSFNCDEYEITLNKF